jgi:hypothetical protein
MIEEEEKYSDFHHQQIFYISLFLSVCVSFRRLIIHCSSHSICLKDRLDRRIASLSLIFFSLLLITVVYIRPLAINEREH